MPIKAICTTLPTSVASKPSWLALAWSKRTITSGSSSESEISTSVAPGTVFSLSAKSSAYFFNSLILLPRRPICTGRLSPRPPPWLETTETLSPSVLPNLARSSSIICCMLRSRSSDGFKRISKDPWLTGLRPLPIFSATIFTSGN